MKRLLTLLMALAMTASLAACGGTGSSGDTADSGNSGTTAEGGETAGSSGVEDGVLTIAMECAYAPYNWSQSDDSNGAVPISKVLRRLRQRLRRDDRQADLRGQRLGAGSGLAPTGIPWCPASSPARMTPVIAGQSMTAERMRAGGLRRPLLLRLHRLRHQGRQPLCRRRRHQRPGRRHLHRADRHHLV